MVRCQTSVVEELREKLRQMERSQRKAQAFSTGIAALDGLLPAGGLEWGTLTEWLSPGEGTGEVTLALLAAGNAMQPNGIIIIVDEAGEFYPPAAADLGIAPERTLLVRPRNQRESLWALEQALRTCCASIVLGWLGHQPNRVLRRLQLAAETGKSLGFLLRPQKVQGEASWAENRLLVETVPRPPSSSGRRLRVTLLRSRGGTGGDAVDMELDDEAGDVRVVSGLAPATAVAYPIRA